MFRGEQLTRAFYFCNLVIAVEWLRQLDLSQFGEPQVCVCLTVCPCVGLGQLPTPTEIGLLCVRREWDNVTALDFRDRRGREREAQTHISNRERETETE